MNDRVILILRMLYVIRCLNQGANSWEAKSYNKALQIISTVDHDMEMDEFKSLPGVGKKIYATICQIYDGIDDNTGVAEINNLLPADYDKIYFIASLIDIDGFGFATANKLFEQGIHSLTDLNKAKLTSRQQSGLKYYLDLKERIPRAKIDHFNDTLNNILSGINFIISGSYRRGLPDSGDIDVLMWSDNPDVTLEMIHNLLETHHIITKILSMGAKNIQGIIQLDNQLCRLDIFFFPNPEELPYALLYTTGSKNLNIKMRAKAKLLGWHLESYSMTDADKNPIIVNNEREIFEKLDMPYLEPTERNM